MNLINSIYNLDRIEFMSLVPDNHFDLAPLDFEYGIGEAGAKHKNRNRTVSNTGHRIRRTASTNYSKKEWDNKGTPEQVVFDEVKRISKNQLFFGANYMMDKICGVENFKTPRRKDFKSFLKTHPKNWIIWDKVNGENDFNDCELIYSPTYNFNSFVYQFMWAGMRQGRGVFDGHIMQGDKSLNEKRIHPTQKPVCLYKFLYHYFKPSNIVDIGAGSFSSVIAGIDMKIDYTAIEKDEEYFYNGVNRINFFKKQLSIF